MTNVGKITLNQPRFTCECVVINRQDNEEQRDWLKRCMCMFHWIQTDYYRAKNTLTYDEFARRQSERVKYTREWVDYYLECPSLAVSVCGAMNFGRNKYCPACKRIRGSKNVRLSRVILSWWSWSNGSSGRKTIQLRNE